MYIKKDKKDIVPWVEGTAGCWAWRYRAWGRNRPLLGLTDEKENRRWGRRIRGKLRDSRGIENALINNPLSLVIRPSPSFIRMPLIAWLHYLWWSIIYLKFIAHNNILIFYLATWFTVMYVHPHGLQEVLENLLRCSGYHSVPVKGEVRDTDSLDCTPPLSICTREPSR